MAAGTVGYEDTRGNNKDYLGMIASQIKNRVTEASDMANDERQFAEKQAELGDTSLDEAGIGRGYFFGKALGSRFGGDAIARTRGRFAKTPTEGIDPAGTKESRFRGGFNYDVTNRIINDAAVAGNNEALTNSVVTGFAGVQQSNIEIAKALIKIDETLAGIERTQMNMARAIMFLGYTMQMMRSESQRASGRDSLRREERSMERGGFRRGFGGGGGIGGQGYGGAGGGRVMKNVTDNSVLGAATSFGSSQLLGKNTKTVKGALQVGEKVAPETTRKIAKALPTAAKTGVKITGDSAEFATKAIGGGVGKTIAKQFNKTGVAKSLKALGANKASIKGVAENIGKNASTFVKKPIALLNPVKIKGLLPAAKAPFGLLPAAGETGIKGMSKMLEKTKLDFLLDDFADVPELSVFDNDLARMTPDEMLDFTDGMAMRTKLSGKKLENAMEVALNSTVDTADEAVDLYAKLLRGDPSVGGIEYTAKEADMFMKEYLGKGRYKEFTKGAKQPFKSAAKATKTTKMLKATTNAAETAVKSGGKAAGKLTAKSAAKSVFKQIPIIAGLAGIYFGLERAMEGDLLGAGLEVTSGILGVTGTTPGIGLAIDSFLLGRDLGMMNKGGKVHEGIGGMIPGGGVNKDTIPTMLTTGEFIMNRQAVDQIGSDTLSFMNNSPASFGYSKLLGGSGSDLDLEGITTNVEEIAPAINSLSQQIVQLAQGGGSNVVNNVVNNYGSGEKPGEGGGDSDGGDFSDSGLDAFRMHYLGSLM